MATLQTSKTERQYYIDWLRIILILSVFLFHIGMIFNPWEWHVKNDVIYSGALRNIMIFLHYWRMPLLFLISGAGTWFALGKRTLGQYLGERFKRLFIPFLAGIFILVPVQVYIEKSGQYASLLDYYPHMFEGIYPEGNFSWHHLWFIVYLFFIALIICPFLNFFRGKVFGRFIRWFESVARKPLALNIVLIPILLSQIILRQYFEVGTNALFNDWASMSFYILFFLSGLVMLPSKKISEAIKSQRYLFLAETILVSTIMFSAFTIVKSEELASIVWDVAGIFLAWSCSLAAIGFAKRYLNKNNAFRKHANEAIYPFYLLHQPVIVILASIVTRWEIPDLAKAMIITLSSFIISVAIYRLLIYRVNFMRVIFGMKPLKKEKVESVRIKTGIIPVDIRKSA